MATTQERNLLATILSSVGRNAANLPNEEIIAFPIDIQKPDIKRVRELLHI